MPPGNQAAAYTLASSFAMVVAKCRMLLPTPFSFLPPSFIYWFCFYRHYSHLLQKKWEFCIPIPFGIEEKKGPPLCKNALVHNGRAGPRRGKNLPRFPDCPAIAPGSLGKPLGFGFSCNLEYKTLLPPFFFGGSFCVSHSLRDWGKKWGHPSAKMHWCITGELALAGGKISCAFRIVPPSLRAVWESPWGLNFHEIRNIKHCSHLFSLRRGRE